MWMCEVRRCCLLITVIVHQWGVKQWYFSFKNQFSFSYRFMCHRFFSISIVFHFWKSFPLQFQLSVFKSLIFQFQFLFLFQGLLYWSINQWHSSYNCNYVTQQQLGCCCVAQVLAGISTFTLYKISHIVTPSSAVTILKSKSKIAIFCQNRPKSKSLSSLSYCYDFFLQQLMYVLLD